MNMWITCALISIVWENGNCIKNCLHRRLQTHFIDVSLGDDEKYCICWNQQIVYLKPLVNQGHGSTLLVVACYTFSEAGDHFKLSSITLWQILIDYRYSFAELTEKSDFNLITAIYLIGSQQHSDILKHLHCRDGSESLWRAKSYRLYIRCPHWIIMGFI